MIKILLLFVSVCLYKEARAQKPDSMVDIELRNTIARKAVRSYFTQYATGQEISGLNNYVNYDTKDNRLTLNGIIPLKNPERLLSVKVNGAVSDGFTTLFTKSKLNSNTALELRLHLLNKKRWEVTLDDKQLYEKKKKELRARYQLKKDSLEFYYQDNQQKLQEAQTALRNYQGLRRDITAENDAAIGVIHLQDQLIRYINYIRNHERALIDLERQEHSENRVGLQLQKELDKFKTERDSLFSQISEAVKLCSPSQVQLMEGPAYPWYKVNLKSIIPADSMNIIYTRRVSSLSREGTLKDQLKQLDREKMKDLESLGDAVKLSEKKLNWITLSAGLADRSFQHITASNGYENQLKTLSFVSPMVSVGFHKIKTSQYSNRLSYYRLLSASVLTSDNFGSLKKLEITESRKSMNKDSTEERLSKKTFNAYSGEYKKNIWAVNIAYDWYGMFNRKQSFGVHVFPAFRIEKNNQEFNLGTGLFMNFLKADTKQALVALEVFAKFHQPLRGDLLNNMTAGIQIGIPINLKQQ